MRNAVASRTNARSALLEQRVTDAGLKPRATGVGGAGSLLLKTHFHRQLPLPREAVLGRDRAERRARRRGVRVLEVGPIQRVISLDAELELTGSAKADILEQ